jgi:hypothetical protein
LRNTDDELDREEFVRRFGELVQLVNNVDFPLAARNSHPQTTRFIPTHKESKLAAGRRKNRQRRKRQKRRLAMRKYIAEKISKEMVA